MKKEIQKKKVRKVKNNLLTAMKKSLLTQVDDMQTNKVRCKKGHAYKWYQGRSPYGGGANCDFCGEIGDIKLSLHEQDFYQLWAHCKLCQSDACHKCCLRMLSKSEGPGLTDTGDAMLIDGLDCMVPKLKTIMGQAYIQWLRWGEMSFVFREPDEEGKGSYLFFKNAQKSTGPTKGEWKDGQLFLKDESWDPKSRTYKGTIDWSPHSYNDNIKTLVRIIFTEDFTDFHDGEYTHIDPEGKETVEPMKRMIVATVLFRYAPTSWLYPTDGLE